MKNETHIFFDPFHTLIRGIRKNRKRERLQAECTGIAPSYRFYWEVKDFFQTRPALIKCKIVLHEYIESIPGAVKMEAAACLLDDLTTIQTDIEGLAREQEQHLKTSYPLLLSGGIKTGEYIEQAEQFNEALQLDDFLYSLPEILGYLQEIMREAKRIMFDCFTSPDPETVSNYIQNGIILQDFQANERRLFRSGLIDMHCKWTGKKTLFQSYMTVINESDYFLRTAGKMERRRFFIERYGDPGEQYMKPGTMPGIDKALEDFPWIRDQTVMKR